MIGRKEIIAEAGMPVVRQAVEIIMHGGIRDATYNIHQYPVIRLAGEITDRSVYRARADIHAEMNRILSYDCSCGRCLYGRPCRHVTALVTVFSDAAEEGRIVLKKPEKETSVWVDRLMKEAPGNSLIRPDTSGRYILEPVF
jgi:hypothetical protein